jgi:peptidyl-prolyl cis-trans isomerase SurA
MAFLEAVLAKNIVGRRAGFGQDRRVECGIVTDGSILETRLIARLHPRGGTSRPTRLAVLGLFLLLALGCVGLSRPAAAQDELKIAAVVNDDVITQLDVFTRLRLAMLSARLQDTPETRQRLLPTVMRTLIDEHLKLQEAKSEGVTVGDGEVNARISVMAKRNNMSREDFEAELSSNGILVSALEDQQRSDIAWARLVQRKLRPTIRITDAEINEAVARARSAQGKTEYHLSVIFQQVDSPKDTSAVQQSAQRLMEQLQAGADFASLAQEFSQDTSASNGGDLGWVRPDQGDPAIGRELERLGNDPSIKGRVLGPIQGTGGYYLVRVEDIRQSDDSNLAPGSVHLVRLLWSLAPNASEKEVKSAQELADAFSTKTQSCDAFSRAAQSGEAGGNASFTDMGRVPVDDMPPDIRQMVINQQVGQPTAGIRGDGGVAIFVVCDRGGADNSRVAIADRLAAERLETLARGYLSDLRRAAYIDIRL